MNGDTARQRVRNVCDGLGAETVKWFGRSSDDIRSTLGKRRAKRLAKIAMAERSAAGNDARYGKPSLEDTSTSKEQPKERTRKAVAKELRVPERKLRHAAMYRRSRTPLSILGVPTTFGVNHHPANRRRSTVAGQS